MIVEILLVCFLAKIKHYKLKYLFRSWTFYPVLITQCILIFFQISIFFGTYYFVRFAPIIDMAVILSFVFSLFVFRLYTPAISGSLSIGLGYYTQQDCRSHRMAAKCRLSQASLISPDM